MHSADLALAHGNMTRVKESLTVAQHQLADAQLALVTVEGETDENRRRLGVEEQWRGNLEVLLRRVCSDLDDLAFLVNSVPNSLLQDMPHDLDVYLRASFA